MTNKSFEDLLLGYLNNSLSKAELDEFLQIVQQNDNQKNLQEAIEQFLADRSFSGITDADKGNYLFKKIMDSADRIEGREGNVIELKGKSKFFTLVRIAAAACIIGVIAFGTLLLIRSEPKKEIARSKNSKPNKNDIPPGGNNALLTLADGTTIVLDVAQNGVLAQQGNTKVIKLNGKLDYSANSSATKEIVYNTISTPRGGQFQVELPDGSQVWLNAASSLRFPTSFVGKVRRVEISGEAYFEVAKNKAMPFIVRVNDAEIQVLGTHFNVMAYNDEATLKTTLLEGAVKFVKEGINTMLKPGQQSQLTKEGQLKVVNDVDLTKVVAWKNGFFDFEGSDLETVAKQLSRWYDVEVIYDRKIDDLFYAKIPRNTKLSVVLKALELTGKVHFQIQGRKIIIIP
jgi:transmembrane sensor